MTKSFQVKYLKFDSRGQYRYRRRVPTSLERYLGKREFVKVLGKTEAEALLAYPKFHAQIDSLIEKASRQASVADPREIEDAIHRLFSENGFDPRSVGKSQNELDARQTMADKILSRYSFDEGTGHPDPDDVSIIDKAIASALLAGANAVQLPCTISVAFNFYLEERVEPDPYKRKKQVQRLLRVKQSLLEVVRHDMPLTEVSRHHARALRDSLLRSRSPATVRRMFNDLKAVFNLAIREYQVTMANPFSRLELPKPQRQAIDNRSPLPEAVIQAMYLDLEGSDDLLDIWTLVHHTGAQPAEILGLLQSDLQLEGSTPHILVKENHYRSLKQAARERRVPLVGLGLSVARRRLIKGLASEEPVFPRYASTAKHDALSQGIMKRLRKHTDSSQHVFYSLRHNMKDSLIKVGASERQQNAILGHSLGVTASEGYGSRPSLEELGDILGRIAFSVALPR